MVLGGGTPAVEPLDVRVPHNGVSSTWGFSSLQADADLLSSEFAALPPIDRLHRVAGSLLREQGAVLAGDGGEAGRVARGGKRAGELQESQVVALPRGMEQQGVDPPGVGAQDEGEGVQAGFALEETGRWDQDTVGAD